MANTNNNNNTNGVPSEFEYRNTFNMKNVLRQWEGIAQADDQKCPLNPTMLSKRKGSSSNGTSASECPVDTNLLTQNLANMMSGASGVGTDPAQQAIMLQVMTKLMAEQFHANPPSDPNMKKVAESMCPFRNGGEAISALLTPSTNGSASPLQDTSFGSMPEINMSTEPATTSSPRPDEQDSGRCSPPQIIVNNEKDEAIAVKPIAKDMLNKSLADSRSNSLSDISAAASPSTRRRSSLQLAKARASGLLPGSRRGSAANSRRGSLESSASEIVRPAKEPTKLNFYVDEKMTVDTLHQKATETTYCNEGKCFGSVMFPPPKRPYRTVRSKEEKLPQAEDFYNQYFDSLKKLNSLEHKMRIKEVREAIESRGVYDHTYDELVFGAKLAWRNAPRCIGRIQWTRLEVFDARDVKTPKDMFDAIIRHLDYATNGGNLRSAITIFPQRTDVKSDFRVWNTQVIRYCGYRQPDGSIIGDPAGVEFTEVCEKLGWKGPGGRFDIAPLVLQANGGKPEVFDIPEEQALQVKLSHPDYDWFADMGLQWYAVPGVSNMLFDCGGMEFCAAPFSGWYMSTEVGSRDLCDPQRYNILQDVAEKMGLDTSSNQTLWKDRACVEVNVAVLHSYKEAGVTLSDHHTAAESFMQHFANETKVRGGCPADWVWIVPPMSSNLTPVFHQEMLTYFLKPSYEYQDMAWRSYDFSQGTEWRKDTMSWKALAISLRFTSAFMTKIRRKRTKALVLYATETGKSQAFAKQLNEMLDYAFDSRVLCMDNYDANDLRKETLVYVVASTFGDGDPPENGRDFFGRLSAMAKEAEKQKKNKGSVESKDLLENLSFSVFALGSRAYPNFCNFGKDVERCFLQLKATKMNGLMEGDELGGQEQAFKDWSGGVYKTAIKEFKVRAAPRLEEITGAMRSTDVMWTPAKFRLRAHKADEAVDVCPALETVHKRSVKNCSLLSTKQLQSADSERKTILAKLGDNTGTLTYEAGDHVGIFPANRNDIVNSVIEKLAGDDHPDKIVSLEMNFAEQDKPEEWDEVKKLPPMSLRRALTNFLDLTTPPPAPLLRQLAALATDDDEKARLSELAQDAKAYDAWRYEHWPHLGDILDEFSSLEMPASFLLSQLPIMQPRFYSISSAPGLHSNEIHTTVAVVEYRTQDGKGKRHYGVCSSWLDKLPEGHDVPAFIRKAPSFKLPEEADKSVIMVGPGSGIAPLRSFWQERYCQKQQGQETGDMTLVFGCRHPDKDDIYRDEIEEMQKEGILTQVLKGYSRLPSQPKTYVQHILKQHGTEIFEKIVEDEGHFYLCGDVMMASEVKAELMNIIKDCGEATEEEAKECLQIIREEGRFHEDIYGAVYRPNSNQN